MTMAMTMKIAITLTLRLIMMIVLCVPGADWLGAMLQSAPFIMRWCWSWWWRCLCWSWWLYLGADWLEVMLQAAPLIPSRLLSPPSRPLTHSHPPHSQVANTNTNTSTHSPPKHSSSKYKYKQSRKDKAEVGMIRGGICPCRHCRWQCKIFANGVNFSIFTHFLCLLLLKLLKLGEIDGVKFLAWKSGGVKILTNSMSGNDL